MYNEYLGIKCIGYNFIINNRRFNAEITSKENRDIIIIKDEDGNNTEDTNIISAITLYISKILCEDNIKKTIFPEWEGKELDLKIFDSPI